MIDAIDKQMLTLLSANARESVANIARKLKISRSTVYERMRRLEESGVIAGYTIRESDDYAQSHITSHVMLSVSPKLTAQVTSELKKIPEIKSLWAVSGVYDLIAVVRAETTRSMDLLLDKIGNMEGIDKTNTSIVLSTKFER